MQEKFTLTGNERIFLSELGKKMMPVYPQAKTLNFIKQFAYAYYSARDLPLPLAAIILN